MNTPLQHAAWAVIARWESPAWKDMPHTGEYIDAMRKALADEQAQALFAGPEKWTSEEIKAGHIGIRWIGKHGVYGRPTQHDVRKYLDARGDDAKCSCDECKAEQAQAVEPATVERAELIAQLLALGIPDWATARYLMQKAAEMLQADADLRTQLARRTVERDMVIRMASEGSEIYGNEAQQVAVPDMFWNHDDADKLYSSISEFLNDEICNGTELAVGDIRTVQRAVRLPNIDIRITSVDENECDADYEIVEAQGAKP